MAISERIVAYGHGYLSPSFFAVHSTANPGATAANHANYWSNNPDYAVHLVSDWNECLHTVPYDRLCWQVGNGNALCEGIEICEATNYDDFIQGMAVARSVILERLEAHGWTVDGNVRSHLWFSQNYGGSDHSDPIPYLERFGWTWDRFISYLKEGDDEVTPEDIEKIVHGVWEYNWEGTAPEGNMYNTLVKTHDRAKQNTYMLKAMCGLGEEEVDAMPSKFDEVHDWTMGRQERSLKILKGLSGIDQGDTGDNEIVTPMHVSLSPDDIERIARRTAEILKGSTEEVSGE